MNKEQYEEFIKEHFEELSEIVYSGVKVAIEDVDEENAEKEAQDKTNIFYSVLNALVNGAMLATCIKILFFM